MSSSKLSKWCDYLVEAGWLAAVIVTPLFFNIYSRRLFEADKLLLLRALVVVMAGAWLINWVEGHGALPSTRTPFLRRALVLPTLIVAATYALSTVISIAPRIAFFGSYTREDGTYTLISLVLIFFFLAERLRTRRQFDRLILAIILGSLPVALYAWVQHFGLDPIWGPPAASDRVSANMGNPVYLGAYLIMVFFLTLGKIGAIVSNFGPFPFRPEIGGRRRLAALEAAVYSFVALAQAGAIFFSGSRGPWLAWFAGFGVFALLLALLMRRRAWAQGAVALGLIGIALLVVLNLLGSTAESLRAQSPLEPVPAEPPLARLTHILNADWEGRPLIWQGVARLMQPHAPIQFPDGTLDALNVIRPLVGYGPESMYLVFERYYPPALTVVNNIPSNTMVGRSHDEAWDVIVTGGFFGFLADQIFFFCLFLYGFRYIGLVSGDHDRNRFGALWFGFMLAGGLLPILIGRPDFGGVGAGTGNVLALITYLTYAAWRPQDRVVENALSRADEITLAAIFAGVLAHYVEIQFGFAISATSLLLWVLAALLVGLGSGQVVEEEAAPVSSPGTVASYALMAALAIATLLYEFITLNLPATGSLDLLRRALTFNSSLGRTSYAVLAIIALVWLFGLFAALTAVSAKRARGRWSICALFALISVGAALGFGLGLADQLVQVGRVAAIRLDEVVSLADRRVSLFNSYVIFFFVLVLCTAASFVTEPARESSTWLASRWSPVLLVPVALAGYIWLNIVNLDPIRADIIYQRGQAYANLAEWDFAIELDRYAIAHAPYEDVYYRGLGQAFLEKARASEDASTTILDLRTSVSHVLSLNAGQIAGLSSADSAYAARAVFARGRELNPLNADPTAGLALALSSLVDHASSPQEKSDLMGQAEQFFAQAVYLRPHDADLWNEWARFDLHSRNDPDAALNKLARSLEQDPRVAQTYLYAGEAFEETSDLASAAAAYQKALSLEPRLPQASLGLAKAYERQGKSAEAIRSYLKYVQLTHDSPDLWEVHRHLALLYKQKGDPAEALGELRLAARLAPNDRQAQVNELLTDWLEQAGTQ